MSFERSGIPILLKYNRETTYKTTIGGIASMVINDLLLLFSIFLYEDANRERSIIISITLIKHLMYDYYI